jgi:hypothetical protein
MIQKQYLTTNLKKSHIERIVHNYNIKYLTMKNEIDNKLNNLIKFILGDILAILEGIQNVNVDNEKIKDFNKSKKETEQLTKKLNFKIQNENKLKQEIENLKNEIKLLKQQVTKNNISNYNSNNNNNIKRIPNKTPDKKNRRLNHSYSQMYKFNSFNTDKKKKLNKQLKNLNYPENINDNINYAFNVEINLNDPVILNENKNIIKHKKNNSCYIGNELLKKRNIKNKDENILINNTNKLEIYKLPIFDDNNIKNIINNYKELINEEDNILKNEEENIKQFLTQLENNK